MTEKKTSSSTSSLSPAPVRQAKYITASRVLTLNSEKENSTLSQISSGQPHVTMKPNCNDSQASLIVASKSQQSFAPRRESSCMVPGQGLPMSKASPNEVKDIRADDMRVIKNVSSNPSDLASTGRNEKNMVNSSGRLNVTMKPNCNDSQAPQKTAASNSNKPFAPGRESSCMVSGNGQPTSKASPNEAKDTKSSDGKSNGSNSKGNTSSNSPPNSNSNSNSSSSSQKTGGGGGGGASGGGSSAKKSKSVSEKDKYGRITKISDRDLTCCLACSTVADNLQGKQFNQIRKLNDLQNAWAQDKSPMHQDMCKELNVIVCIHCEGVNTWHMKDNYCTKCKHTEHRVINSIGDHQNFVCGALLVINDALGATKLIRSDLAPEALTFFKPKDNSDPITNALFSLIRDKDGNPKVHPKIRLIRGDAYISGHCNSLSLSDYKEITSTDCCSNWAAASLLNIARSRAVPIDVGSQYEGFQDKRREAVLRLQLEEQIKQGNATFEQVCNAWSLDLDTKSSTYLLGLFNQLTTCGLELGNAKINEYSKSLVDDFLPQVSNWCEQTITSLEEAFNRIANDRLIANKCLTWIIRGTRFLLAEVHPDKLNKKPIQIVKDSTAVFIRLDMIRAKFSQFLVYAGDDEIASDQVLSEFRRGVLISIQGKIDAKAKIDQINAMRNSNWIRVAKDAKPDVKPNVKPDAKPDVKPNVKPDVKPDVKIGGGGGSGGGGCSTNSEVSDFKVNCDALLTFGINSSLMKKISDHKKMSGDAKEMIKECVDVVKHGGNPTKQLTLYGLATGLIVASEVPIDMQIVLAYDQLSPEAKEYLDPTIANSQSTDLIPLTEADELAILHYQDMQDTLQAINKQKELDAEEEKLEIVTHDIHEEQAVQEQVEQRLLKNIHCKEDLRKLCIRAANLIFEPKKDLKLEYIRRREKDQLIREFGLDPKKVQTTLVFQQQLFKNGTAGLSEMYNKVAKLSQLLTNAVRDQAKLEEHQVRVQKLWEEQHARSMLDAQEASDLEIAQHDPALFNKMMRERTVQESGGASDITPPRARNLAVLFNIKTVKKTPDCVTFTSMEGDVFECDLKMKADIMSSAKHTVNRGNRLCGEDFEGRLAHVKLEVLLSDIPKMMSERHHGDLYPCVAWIDGVTGEVLNISTINRKGDKNSNNIVRRAMIRMGYSTDYISSLDTVFEVASWRANLQYSPKEKELVFPLKAMIAQFEALDSQDEECLDCDELERKKFFAKFIAKPLSNACYTKDNKLVDTLLNIELPTKFRQGLMQCCQLAFGVYIHLDDRCDMHPGAVLKELEEQFKPRLTSILGISGFERVEELVIFCTGDEAVSDDLAVQVEVEVEVEVKVDPKKKKNTSKQSGFERRMR